MRAGLVALAKLAVSVALITLVVRVFDVRGVMGHIARIDAASLPGAGLWLAGGYSSEGLKHAVNFAKEASMERASAEDRARSGKGHGKP